MTRTKKIAKARRVDAGFKIADALDDDLQLSFRDFVGEKLGFIRDEIVKALPMPGIGVL